MGVRNLAEAIILQSIEDLWNKEHRGNCIRFFNGHAFNICAGIAGINPADQEKLLNMINGSIEHKNENIKNLRRGSNIEYPVS